VVLQLVRVLLLDGGGRGRRLEDGEVRACPPEGLRPGVGAQPKRLCTWYESLHGALQLILVPKRSPSLAIPTSPPIPTAGLLVGIILAVNAARGMGPRLRLFLAEVVGEEELAGQEKGGGKAE